jgi:hypothetical protein
MRVMVSLAQLSREAQMTLLLASRPRDNVSSNRSIIESDRE